MRQFCNLVYARLAAMCPDGEAREHLDRELAAPPGGWDQAERNLLTAMARMQAEEVV